VSRESSPRAFAATIASHNAGRWCATPAHEPPKPVAPFSFPCPLRDGTAQGERADEYDAAQERGEVRGHGNKSDIPKQNITVKDIGLTSKQIHEARSVRDAEKNDPGVVRRTLAAALAVRLFLFV
jgi:hypothetical protein